jgi:hypothetical protein
MLIHSMSVSADGFIADRATAGPAHDWSANDWHVNAGGFAGCSGVAVST